MKVPLLLCSEMESLQILHGSNWRTSPQTFETKIVGVASWHGLVARFAEFEALGWPETQWGEGAELPLLNY